MSGIAFVCVACRTSWTQPHLEAVVCIACGSDRVRPKTPFTDGSER